MSSINLKKLDKLDHLILWNCLKSGFAKVAKLADETGWFWTGEWIFICRICVSRPYIINILLGKNINNWCLYQGARRGASSFQLDIDVYNFENSLFSFVKIKWRN